MNREPETYRRRHAVASIPRVGVLTAILFCFLMGTVLPAAFGMMAGIREPVFHDEFSYLLGADTFARGRLTNPSPRLPEFFETEHVLVTPTYQSKYPPAQALVLALGQRILGHPIWGVWLGAGLFAAALYWMLLTWASPASAFIVTLLAVVTLGTSTYWAQSYWGGMVAATGAAMFFGGVRRTVRVASGGASAAVAAGALVLANSRPYEGLLVAVPGAVVLMRWLLTSARDMRRTNLVRFAVPLVCVLCLGAVAMGVYNRAVTGRYLLTPYILHEQQYAFTGAFLFGSATIPERTPVERVRRFWLMVKQPHLTTVQVIGRAASNFVLRIPVSLGPGFGFLSSPEPNRQPFRGVTIWLVLLACLGPASILELIVVTIAALLTEWLAWRYFTLYPWPLAAPVMGAWIFVCFRTLRDDAWARFAGVVIVCLMAGRALGWGWLPHYVAPAVPLVLAVVAIAVQRLAESGTERWNNSLALRLAAILALYIGAIALLAGGERGHVKTDVGTPLQTRGDVLRRLDALPGSHLVFVSYSPEYTMDVEWVYNGADLQHPKVLFAHDLGDETNPRLLDAYTGRTAWRLRVDPRAVALMPYATGRPSSAARPATELPGRRQVATE